MAILIYGGEAVATKPPLLLHIGMNHLCDQAGRQPAVLATFKETDDGNLRIASRRDADEPAIVLELRRISGSLAECVADDLRGSSLAGEINPGKVRAGRGTDGIDHLGHC